MTTAPALPALPEERSAGAERPLAAIGLVLIAVALFSVMDALSKLLTTRLDPLEIVWGRYFVLALLLAPAVARRPRVVLARQPLLQLVRGLSILAAALLFIAGLARLGLADATAIGFASPLLVTALSVLLLGETVGIRRCLAVATGFLGVLVVVRPGSGAIGAAALLPLGSAACWALSIVVTRRMRGADQPITTLLWSTLSGFAASSVLLPFVWVAADVADWTMMSAMGILSGVGQYLLIAGLHRGAASLLAPFTYSQMVWSALLGLAVFGTAPTPATWWGALLIEASGVYIAHRERLRTRPAAAL